MLYERIRKAHEREELSVRELARRFHVHRRDVRQALASAVPPGRKVPGRAAPAQRQAPMLRNTQPNRRATTSARSGGNVHHVIHRRPIVPNSLACLNHS